MGLDYVKQQFSASQTLTPVQEEDQNLIASTLEQSFRRALAHGITFQERFSISAPWNNLNAYTTGGNVTLTLPVYKSVSFTLGVLDTFLNNPPPGFRKNSFQFTTGLTYTLP